MSPGFPGGLSFPKGEDLDPMERMIRQRQKEAEERKNRTMAAYDMIAKQGAGLSSRNPLHLFIDHFSVNQRSKNCLLRGIQRYWRYETIFASKACFVFVPLFFYRSIFKTGLGDSIPKYMKLETIKEFFKQVTNFKVR